MISNDALKLLKWFAKQDKWINGSEVRKDCKHYKEHSLKALVAEKYLEDSLDLDGDQWVKYRISDLGKAYLEDIRAKRLPELRDWINALLPILTFLGGLLLSDPVKGFFRWLFDLLS